MEILQLEITNEMDAKLQEMANKYAVEPTDIAKMILASELAKSDEPCWADRLTVIISRVTDAVIAISKMEVPNK